MWPWLEWSQGPFSVQVDAFSTEANQLGLYLYFIEKEVEAQIFLTNYFKSQLVISRSSE